jgi:Protein of unknown function DUF86
MRKTRAGDQRPAGDLVSFTGPSRSIRLPIIPWTAVIRMRHVIVHDYLGVDEDIVWQVVSHDVRG